MLYMAKVVNREIYLNRGKLTLRREVASKYSHPSAANKAIESAKTKFPRINFEAVRW